MFEERLESLQNFDFAGNPGWRRRLSFDNCHAQGAFVPSDQTLQVFQEELKTPQSESVIVRVCYCIVLYCIVFIHSNSAFHSMSLSEALLTTAITLCRSLHAEALQATVSEGLAQGRYVVARAGFEPTTLWTKGVDTTNAPPIMPHISVKN